MKVSKDTHAPWRNEELLCQKYVVEGKSTTTIADEWDCGSTTVSSWLERHDINKRDRGGHPDDAPWKQADTLRRLYHEEGLTMPEIADKYNVAYSTINNAFERNGVEKYEQGGKPADMAYKDRDWLNQKYKKERVSAKELADRCGCHVNTIRYHLRKFGIERYHHRKEHDGGGTIPYTVIYHREDNQNYIILVHRVVAYGHGKLSAQEFLEGKKHVHHKDGNPWINSPENLEVLTPQEHEERHKD
jgi:transposase